MSKWEKEDETPYLVCTVYRIAGTFSLTVSRYKFTNKTRSERRASTLVRRPPFMTPTKALKIPPAKERRMIVFQPAKKK
jgi:hypothetical protein